MTKMLEVRGPRFEDRWCDAKRMKRAEALLPLEQLLVAERKQRAPQRREHGQLVVRPLDRGQGGADGLDFFAAVEGLAADEDVMDATRLQRPHVGLRHVVAEAEKAPEQDADVTGLDPPSAHLPAALVDQPVDEGADGVGQRGLDLHRRHVADAVWFGHRQRQDRRLSLDVIAVAVERNVVRLQRERVAGHDRRERRVHDRLDLRHAAEAGGQLHGFRSARHEPLAHVAINADIGAPEAVDRLLRIADDEEAARHRRDLAPVVLLRIRGREQQEDLGLERIGILEFVDEDVRESRLETAADAGVAGDQVAGFQQQIEEVERTGPGLQRFVAGDGARQLGLQRRREVRVGVEAELIELRLQCVVSIDDPLARDALLVARSPAVSDA